MHFTFLTSGSTKFVSVAKPAVQKTRVLNLHDECKRTFLDTSGNNDVFSIVMIDVHLYQVASVFSLRNLCIYIGMFAVLPNASES